MREKKEFEEKVLQIDRVTRVVAGGRRLRFRAAVVVGNRAGKVGMGVAKANDVTEAIAKATTAAKKNIVTVPIKNETIPFEMKEKFNATTILLKPAHKGTGLIAGGVVRNVLELAGVKNVISKIYGSTNKINCLHTIFRIFQKMKEYEEKKEELQKIR